VNRPTSEFPILAVGKDLRIKLPQSVLQKVDWIAGKQPVDGWLLVANPGRCRLLSAAEVDNDPALQALLARIGSEINAPVVSALEFRDDASVALALRLMPIRITPPAPGWRLTLPTPIAAVMRIRPGESDVAAMFVQGHIEFWTMENLRVAMTQALSDIL
jgi:hypothetical protein